MPFKSESQRRYMWMHHPEIAKKWAHEYPNQGKLPMHKKKSKGGSAFGHQKDKK